MFELFTPLSYSVLTVLWAIILGLYLVKLRHLRKVDGAIAVLLIILALDAFRTLFESAYFGLYFNSLFGFLPAGIGTTLGRPELIVIPKAINIIAGLVVLILLIRRWIPGEIREKEAWISALAASEERFERAMEASNDGIFDWDLLTNDLYMSPGWKRMLGYEYDELPNEFSVWETLTAPEDIHRAWEMQQELVGGQRDRFELEFRMKHKDGHWVDILSRASVVFGENGTAIRIVGTHLDITNRKRAEEALRYKTALLEAQLNSTIDGIVIVDAQGKKVLQNRQTINLWKIPPHVADNDDDETQVQHVMHMTKYPERFVEQIAYLYSHPDETSRDELELVDGVVLDRYSAPVLGKDGHCYGRIWTFRDITERKRTEEKLRESEQRLRSYFNSPIIGIAITSPEKGWLEVNPRLCALLGYSWEELLGGLTWADLTHPDDIAANVAQFERLLVGEIDNYSLDKRFVRKSGEIIWTRLGVVCVRKSDGIVEYLVSTLEDITERTRTEEALRESETRFKALAETSPIAIYTSVGKDQVAEYINPTFTKLFGYTLEEIPSVKAWWPLAYPDEDYRNQIKSKWQRQVEHAIETQTDTEPLEVVVTTKDGSKKNIAWTFITIGDRNWACGLDLTERKQAEEALRESEYFFKESQRAAFIGSYKADFITDTWESSEVLDRIFGIGQDFIRTIQSWVEIVHPDDREMLSRYLHETVIAQSQPFNMEYRITRKSDGEIRWVSGLGEIHLDSEGNVVSLIGTIQDITERKRAERELQRARTILQNAEQIANQGAWEWDIVKDEYTFSENWKRIHGADVTLIGREALMLIAHPDDAENVEAAFQEALAGRARYDLEHRIVRVNDGQVRVVHAVGDLVYDASGQPVRMYGVAQDITERKQTEEERERLMAAIEQAGETIVITDAEGTIQYANPFFEKATGYTCEEAIAQNPRILNSGEHDDAFYKEMWDTLTRGEVWTGRMVNKKKNGALFTEEATISPVRDASGKTVNYVAVKRDITHEIALRAQLRQAQKMEAVGQLAGGIAHDFNNLLQVIFGYGEVALREAGADSPVYGPIEEVLKAGERAKRLVGQLLAFSRRQVLEMKDVNLNDSITELSKMLQRVIGEHITLEVIRCHNLGVVRADSGQIDQILMNLCVNARDAMGESGKITIETENVFIDEEFCEVHTWAKPGRYVLLSVTDTGCGMDQETLGKVFEPFFTTKDVGKGTGLGLATVYGVVKQHQGFVHVYSEVGKGTTFKLYLPLTERSAAVARTRIEGPVPDGTETILLAEDEETLLNLTKTFLEHAGYTVLTASNGADALRVFEEHADEIDMALLDVMMPNLGGKAVYERIRETRPDLPFLFSSGYSMSALHTNFVLDEGLQLVQKPFRRVDLLRKVRDVLDGGSAARNSHSHGDTA